MRLSRFVLLLVVVVVLAVASCRIVLAQNLSDASESELRKEQDVIACKVAANDTLSEIFKSTIRERHGVDPDFGWLYVQYLSQTTVGFESASINTCDVELH